MWFILVGGIVYVDREKEANDEDLEDIFANVHMVDDTATLKAHTNLVSLTMT